MNCPLVVMNRCRVTSDDNTGIVNNESRTVSFFCFFHSLLKLQAACP